MMCHHSIGQAANQLFEIFTQPLQIVAPSSRNPTSYSEPAAKQAARQLKDQSHIPDDYLADEESVMESSSISSDSEWERLSDFSGSTVSESSEDDSDWEL